MDNRVALFEEKLRYSSFEVKGGFGSTNDYFVVLNLQKQE